MSEFDVDQLLNHIRHSSQPAADDGDGAGHTETAGDRLSRLQLELRKTDGSNAPPPALRNRRINAYRTVMAIPVNG